MILYPKNYCVFDFETSGLDPKKDRIIQIGALRVIDGKQDEQCSWFIKYEDNFKIPEIITKITGITDSMVDVVGIKFEDAWNDFVQFVDDLPMVGHNIIRFDIPFLFEAQSKLSCFDINQSINIHNIKQGDIVSLKNRYFDYNSVVARCIDTAGQFKAKKLNFDRYYNETLYEFWSRALEVRVPGLKYNVGVVCDELGIDKTNVQQHRAEGDVYLTNLIYRKLCLKDALSSAKL